MTFLSFLFTYPTLRLFTMSREAVNRLEPAERAGLMNQALIPGPDMGEGYRFDLTVDVSRLTEQGRIGLLSQVRDILARRINAAGILEYRIHSEQTGALSVETPVNVDSTLMAGLLSDIGHVSLHLLKDGQEVQTLRQRMDAALMERAAADTLGTQPSITFSQYLTSLAIDQGMEDIVVAESNVPTVERILADTTIQRVMRGFNLANPPAGAFVWGAEPVEENGARYIPLYFINQEPDVDAQPIVDAQVDEASIATGHRSRYAVRLTLNDAGREKLDDVTGANVGNRVAVLMNNRVQVTMALQGRIGDGRVETPAGNTVEQASLLAATLEQGVLPSPPVLNAITRLSSTSGSIMPGLAVGFLLTGVLFILVYRATGAVAAVGLAYHLLTTLALLKVWEYAGFTPIMTLSSLAGLGLSTLIFLGGQITLFESIRNAEGENFTIKMKVLTGVEESTGRLLWMHGVILALSLLFVPLGTGPMVNGALGLSAGTAASLVTLFVLTRPLMTTTASVWTLSRLSI